MVIDSPARDLYEGEAQLLLGEEVVLEYPNGMISWLTSHTSDYDGAPCNDKGNLEDAKNTDGLIYVDSFTGFFELIFNAILKLFGIK